MNHRSDEEAAPRVEDVPPTTEAADPDPVEKVDIAEPESVKEVEVTEAENPEETRIDDTPPAPEPVSEPPSDVREVPVDAEPIIATPLLAAPISENVVEPAAETALVVVDSVGETAPDVVSEENLIEEGGVLAPQTKEVEEPVTVIAESVEETAPVVVESIEESEPSPDVIEQKDTTPAVSERVVEEPTPQPDVSATEHTTEEVPPVEPQSTAESPETEVIEKPAPEEPVINGVEQEEVPPAISEPTEAEQEASIPDVPREEVKPIERPWTPSYSVSSQGGGLDNAVPADEEISKPTVAPGPPAEEPVVSASEVEVPTEVRIPRISFPSACRQQPSYLGTCRCRTRGCR